MSAIMGAIRHIPASLAQKALSKVDKRFSNYFAKSAAYGIDATRALDYLSERFESDKQREYKDQLEKGAKNNTLRPDEMVSRSEISNSEMPGRALRTAAGFAAGGALGLGGEGMLGEEDSGNAPISPEQTQDRTKQKPETMTQGIEKGIANQKNRPAEAQFPELISFVRQKLGDGIDPEEIYQYVKQAPEFRQTVDWIEKKDGRPFLERIMSYAGQRGQQGQKSQGKEQLANTIMQATQVLKGLRGG